MLGGDTEAVAEAGSTVWPRLAAAYLEARLSHMKPADGPSGDATTSDLCFLTIYIWQSPLTGDAVQVTQAG